MSKDENITPLEKALQAVEEVIEEVKVKPAQNDNNKKPSQ